MKNQDGLSLLELLIVMVIMSIMATFTLLALSSPRKYFADDQAIRVVNVFDEARQMALNQRRVFRVEINRTKKQITLINEGEKTDTAADDFVVKRVLFNNDVVINEKPGEVTTSPATASPAPILPYISSNYPLSNGEQKVTLRFLRNGRVVDAGNNNIGGGSLVTGATVYVHTINPKTSKPDIIRAVTLLGPSANTAIFKCVINAVGNCGEWRQ